MTVTYWPNFQPHFLSFLVHVNLYHKLLLLQTDRFYHPILTMTD